MGSICKRGNTYWIQYYRNGKPYRETTKSKKEADAKRLLKKREGEISEDKLPGVYFDRVPYIPMLKEYNVRKGFFEHAEFVALRDTLPYYLKGFVTFAYKTGWRVSEITSLTWNQVDSDNGIVRLESGETKNDEARTVYLDDELQEIFNHQWESRKRSRKLTPYVFPNLDGKGRINDFRKSWNKACKDTKIGKKLFHDFRRTAARNMVRAGIPEDVAMMISGHKTRSIFERYKIVNDSDLQLAAQKQAVYLESQISTVSSTVYNLKKKAAN